MDSIINFNKETFLEEIRKLDERFISNNFNLALRIFDSLDEANKQKILNNVKKR